MLMCLEKSREAGSRRGMAFTLIELLVVVSIIALLVGILAPSVNMAIKEAANARTIVRVAELAGGCNIYHDTHEYYPGQRYPHKLLGSSQDPGDPVQFTGSQWLARSLFSDPDPAATLIYPKPQYAPLKAKDLIDPKCNDGDFNFDIGTISDRNTAEREFMAILYYPARLGVSGLTQYKEADNSDYTSGHTGPKSKSFSDFIKDERFGSSDTPYAPGAFLIIAAGKDRLYFTSDDIRYPAFKSN